MLGIRRFLIATIGAIFTLFTVFLFIIFDIYQTITINYIILAVVFALFVASEIVIGLKYKNSALKTTFSFVMPAYVLIEMVLVLIFAIITNIIDKEFHRNVTLFIQLPLFLTAALVFTFNFMQYYRISCNQERQKQNKVIINLRRASVGMDNIPLEDYDVKRMLDNVKLKLSTLPIESLAGLEEIDSQIDNEIMMLNSLFTSDYNKDLITKQLRVLEQLINQRNLMRSTVRR